MLPQEVLQKMRIIITIQFFCLSTCNAFVLEEGIHSSKCHLFETFDKVEQYCPNITVSVKNLRYAKTVNFQCHNSITEIPFFITTYRAIIADNNIKITIVKCSNVTKLLSKFRHSEISFLYIPQIVITDTHCDNSSMELNEGEFTNLNVSYINIFSACIKELPSSLFPKELDSLTISETNLTTLPENIFNNTHQLHYLSLSKNALQYLPSLLFQYLENLETLYLYGNKLYYLDENLFAGLRSLTKLDLSNNHFHSFHSNIFKPLISLEELDVSGNYLTTPEQYLLPLVNLRKLYMNSCNLSNLDEHSFQNMSWLESLRAANNPLIFYSKINASNSIFLSPSNLNELNLENCGIGETFPTLLNNFPRFFDLILTKNNIKFIPEDLPNLVNLRQINLSHNQINFLHPNAFRNVFKQLYPTFNDSLRSYSIQINLSHNLLEKIYSESFQNFAQLRLLDLSHNRLTWLYEDMFKGTHNINYLGLNNNQLRVISRQMIEHLFNLQVLDVSHNKMFMIYISDTFLANLVLLDISFNEIIELNILNLENKVSSLQRLYARNNNISFIRSWFLVWLNLNYLDLSNNNITVLDYWLCLNLRYLDLSNNSINTIQDEWRVKLKYLNYLNLSSNQITRISSFNLRFASFNLTVDVQNNKIEFIDLHSRELNLGTTEANSTVILNLNHNPFFCSCDVFQFLRLQNRDLFLTSENQNVAKIIADNLKCSRPLALKEASVENIEDWTLQSLTLFGLCQL